MQVNNPIQMLILCDLFVFYHCIRHLDKDFKRRSMDKMDEFLAASGK